MTRVPSFDWVVVAAFALLGIRNFWGMMTAPSWWGMFVYGVATVVCAFMIDRTTRRMANERADSAVHRWPDE